MNILYAGSQSVKLLSCITVLIAYWLFFLDGSYSKMVFLFKYICAQVCSYLYF